MNWNFQYAQARSECNQCPTSFTELGSLTHFYIESSREQIKLVCNATEIHYSLLSGAGLYSAVHFTELNPLLKGYVLKDYSWIIPNFRDCSYAFYTAALSVW